ncbi:MAG: TonB-dependent receptor, partial [bacterium]
IRTAGSTTAVFFIRGVGLADFSSNATSSVAVYVDGVPMNSPALQLGQLFDIQDFSVLKGPQSGGAGRNASAGAIRIRSREPGFAPSGDIRVSAGQLVTEDAIDAFKLDVQGGFDVPIIEDVLTSRLAFNVRSQDPFITNRCGGAPPIEERTPRTQVICGENTSGFFPVLVPGGLESEVGEKVDWGARSVFKLVPPDFDGSFLFNFHARQLRQDATLGQGIGTGSSGTFFGGETARGYRPPEVIAEFEALRNSGIPTPQAQEILSKSLAENRPLDRKPFDGDFNRVGQTRLDHYGTSIRAEFELGDVSVKSVSGFDFYDRSRNTDQDFTPDVLFEGLIEDNAWQFAQELQLEGELERWPLRWETGGTYLTENLSADLLQNVNAPIPAPRQFRRTFTQKTQSFALYGRISYDFLEDFTLEAGARYNWEQKTFEIDEFRFNSEFGNEDIRTWQEPTGAISLRYRMTETISAFWKYSRGFKAGHFNSNTVFEPPASPERIDAFEVGLKGSFWGDRLSLDAAFFSYDYEDYQVFIFQDEPGGNPPTLAITNADDVRVIGADAEMVLQPLLAYAPEEIESLRFTLRFGWLDTKFLRFTTLQNRVNGGQRFQIVDDSSGNPLINSPEFKVSGTIDWKIYLGRLGSITPRYDFTWTDDIFFDQTAGFGGLNGLGERGKPEFTTGQPALLLHNIRLSYRDLQERFEVSGWCRNVTDERYKTAAFDASAFAKTVINFLGEPRTCGAELSLFW